MSRTRVSRVDHRQLAARLTDRDRWLLRMLAEHRVLTTTQLALLAFPSLRAAQLRLATLHHELGVINKFQPLTPIGSAPLHWVLDTAGAAALAAEQHHPERHRPSRSTSRHRTRRPHSLEIAHSNQLRHLVGINTCLTSLVATARTHPNQLALDLWWSQARCTRHPLFTDHIRPDAYARWTHRDTRSDTHLEFFFEYDLGTEPARQLAAKLTGYHNLADATHIATPVLIWLPTPTREHAARAALAAALATLPTPGLVPVATTHTPPHPVTPPIPTATMAGDPLTAHPTWSGPGLAGQAWWPLHRQPHSASGLTNRYTAQQASGRFTLASLAELWQRDATTSPPAPTVGPSGHALRAGADDKAAPRPMPPPASTHPATHR